MVPESKKRKLVQHEVCVPIKHLLPVGKEEITEWPKFEQFLISEPKHMVID